VTRLPGLILPALERCDDRDEAIVMDEETFRAFYDRTARPLWVYLARATGDAQSADDLLQETYYRFVRARHACETDAHRRHYLFRIAINLVRDCRRRRRLDCVPLDGTETAGAPAAAAGRARDLASALARLRPRDRDLLWLAYANGSTHAQIAETLGLRAASVKLLLFRARRRLAGLLGRDAPATVERSRR
jgi:RNA polymerase sigma-70 factor (ECF subfamily)